MWNVKDAKCLLIKSTEEKGRYALWSPLCSASCHIIFNASNEVDDSLFFTLKKVDKQFGFRHFLFTQT